MLNDPGAVEGEPIGLEAAAAEILPAAEASSNASDGPNAPEPESSVKWTPGIFKPALAATWRMVGERFERAGADPLGARDVDDLAQVWSDAIDHYLKLNSPLAGAALLTAVVFGPRALQLRKGKGSKDAKRTPGQAASEPRWRTEEFDESSGQWVPVKDPNAN